MGGLLVWGGYLVCLLEEQLVYASICSLLIKLIWCVLVGDKGSQCPCQCEHFGLVQLGSNLSVGNN